MAYHVFLPKVDLPTVSLHPRHERWLEDWLIEFDGKVEEGDVSSSMCLQAAISEIVLTGGLQRSWENVLEDWLTDDSGIPIAYSEKYAERLYKFDNQWKQRPVHASHARWWIGRLIDTPNPRVADHVLSLIQDSGWVYNPDVSSTRLSNRMNAEFTMSLAMALEIYENHPAMGSGYPQERRNQFTAKLSNYPSTDYLSAEYFRTHGLISLGKSHLTPSHLFSDLAESCQVGEGYCDFNVEDKTDDYMGTEKRTGRDFAVHSALSTLHVLFLADFMEESKPIRQRSKAFGDHLSENPTDIPPFEIRDLPHPFGTGLSPLEVVAASFLIPRDSGTTD